MTQPTREERAWAAGFFDGEGHTGASAYTQASSKRYVYLKLMLGQVLPEGRAGVVRFRRIFGSRASLCPKKAHKGSRRQLVFTAHAPDEIMYALGLMWPWLTRRKKDQAKKALAAWRKSPGGFGGGRRAARFYRETHATDI